MTTATFTPDWISEFFGAENAAKAAASSQGIFTRNGQWFLIDGGNAFTATAEQAQIIEAEFAASASMLIEFGAIDTEAEFTAEDFEASQQAQAQAFNAEAQAKWMQDCRNGFASF